MYLLKIRDWLAVAAGLTVFFFFSFAKESLTVYCKMGRALGLNRFIRWFGLERSKELPLRQIGVNGFKPAQLAFFSFAQINRRTNTQCRRTTSGVSTSTFTPEDQSRNDESLESPDVPGYSFLVPNVSQPSGAIHVSVIKERALSIV